MIRNLKTLGLALVAVCAISGVASSAASAVSALFTAAGVSPGVKAAIHGLQTATDTFAVAGASGALSCTKATVSGEAISAGPSSTFVILQPTYETCRVTVPIIGKKTATVTMNGCAYTFNATKNTKSPGGALTSFSADLHLTCPVGNQIEIHVYDTTSENDAGAELLCTYDVGAQTANNQIELTNTVTHDIIAHLNVTFAVTNTKTGSFYCGKSASTTAVYKGEDTLRVTTSGAPLGSTVS